MFTNNFTKKARNTALATAMLVLAFCVYGGVKNQIAHAQDATELSNAQSERSVLEAQLAQLEAEIAAKQKELTSQKTLQKRQIQSIASKKSLIKKRSHLVR